MEGPNPYAAPAADFLASAPSNEHEATRRRLIGTESNIRSLGLLMILAGVLTVPAGIAALSESSIAGVIALVVAGIAFYGGVSLRSLEPIGRILYTVLAALAIVRDVWSIVTLFSFFVSSSTGMGVFAGQLLVILLFLALLWGSNAREIFTDHYRRVVVPATSYVKAKTSVIAIVFLVILVVGLISAIAATVAR